MGWQRDPYGLPQHVGTWSLAKKKKEKTDHASTGPMGPRGPLGPLYMADIRNLRSLDSQGGDCPDGARWGGDPIERG